MSTAGRLPWILSLSAIGLLTTLPFWNVKGDDVYITYRYVVNLVEHGQLAYNLGEPTYGFTSPLWLGVQSLFYVIFRNIYLSSWIACLFSFVACIVGLWLLAEQMIRSNWLRFFSISMLLVDPWFMRWAFAGQEITCKIAVAALLICFTSNAVRHTVRTRTTDIWAGAAYTAGILTRPEIGLLVLFLIGAFIHSRQYKRAFAIGMLVTALYGSWACFCHATFGEFLPHTILVKTTTLGTAFSLSDKLARVFTFSIPRYGAIVVLPMVGLLSVTLVLLVASVKARLRMSCTSVPMALATCWVSGVTVGYIVSGAYMASMYTLIFSPFIPLIMCGWIEAMARDRPKAHLGRLMAGPLLWAFLWSAGMLTVGGLGSFSWMSSSRYNEGDDINYIQYAKWIRENVPEHARIATIELGIVGFFGHRYMIDLAGIATPGMLHDRDSNVLRTLAPTHFSLYGRPVDHYGPYRLRAIRDVSFLRVGGGNAVRGNDLLCTLYEVIGMKR
jgi:hypothetical protein